MSQEPLATPDTGRVQEDRARAEIELPIDADVVFEFVSDIERLLHLNPHLLVESWQSTPGGIQLTALNETTGRRIETAASVESIPAAHRIVLNYAEGLKRATTVSVEGDGGKGCRLILTDHYPVVEDEQDPRLVEVDRSLVAWVDAIRRHLLERRRWGWLPGWRWWHERFLARIAPCQRRIVRMIVWIGVLEFVVFLIVATIFWLELQRG